LMVPARCRAIEQPPAERHSMDQERELGSVDTEPVSNVGSAQDVQGADWELVWDQVFRPPQPRHLNAR
jgi:hypothetical protein